MTGGDGRADLAADGEEVGSGPSRRWLWLTMLGMALVTTLAAAPGTWVRATFGAHTTADEPHYLVTAISLFEDGDLDVADEMAAERYRPFHEVRLPPQAATRPDGRAVVPHDPLLPVLLAVPVGIGGWVGAKLALAVVAGVLAAATVWVAVRRFAIPLGPAVATVALSAMSVPLAPYGTQVYPELPAALATVAAVGAVLGRPRLATAVAFVVAVVALPWLSVKYVPVAAALAGVGLWRWWRQGPARVAIATVAGFAVAGAGYVAGHLAWYGGLTAYAAGDFFQEHGGQLTVVGLRPDYLGRARRLIGLLIDDEFGIGVWQPLWLLAVPAVAGWARRRHDGWAVVTLPLAAGWLTATFLALTMHGWWFPGRQVVVVLPLAAIVVSSLAARSRGWLAGVVAAGLVGVVSYGFLVVEGLRGDLRWIIDAATTSNPWYRTVKPLFVDYLEVSTRTWVTQGIWTAVLGLAAWWLWRTTAPAAHPPEVSGGDAGPQRDGRDHDRPAAPVSGGSPAPR